MKILYDHQIFTLQKYGGISRYFYELVREFNTMQNIDYEISLLLSNNYYISDKKFVNYIDLLHQKNFRGKHRIFNLLNKLFSILKLKQKEFDIFHPTYYDPYFLKHIGNKRFVLTVHDMIHEKFKEMFPINDRTTERKRILVHNASKIISVSNNTKKDLIDLFGVDESKIEVIYHGNSMDPNANSDIRFNLPNRYLLFVGNRGGYKNFERFINSVSKIIKEYKDLYIVCAGGNEFNIREKQLFSELGISNRILQYNLDDKNLAYFYKNALAFVFPSLYEGFGIPILEAFACGCPVICSNTSSFPEVAGSGAFYFDPYSEESIKNAVLRIIEDSSLRERLVIEGYERVKQFSWKKTAEKTKLIYESLL